MNLARALKPRFFRTPPIRISGWWYTYPPEKYKSQLGWLFPIYGKIKHVPKQQPDMRIGHSGGWGGVGGAITFMSLETTTFYALALLLHLHTHTCHATLWGSLPLAAHVMLLSGDLLLLKHCSNHVFASHVQDHIQNRTNSWNYEIQNPRVSFRNSDLCLLHNQKASFTWTTCSIEHHAT